MEIRPLVHLRLSQVPLREKIPPTAPRTTKTSGRAIPPFPFHLSRFLRRDFPRLFYVVLAVATVVADIFSIIKCQLGHCWDGLSSKECQVVDVDVRMIVRGCDYSTIGLTGVVDET